MPLHGVWVIEASITVGASNGDYNRFKMAAQKNIPKDAQVMMAILKEMGVTEYEPRVINQMLEFSYRKRYLYCIL